MSPCKGCKTLSTHIGACREFLEIMKTCPCQTCLIKVVCGIPCDRLDAAVDEILLDDDVNAVHVRNHSYYEFDPEGKDNG